MADIGSGIVGSFNQANLASRLADAEKARARKVEEDRLREARRRVISTQEAVDETRALSGRRVEPDKEGSHGQDARDQYEAHGGSDRADSGDRGEKPAAGERPADASPTEPRRPLDLDSGHLVDLEA